MKPFSVNPTSDTRLLTLVTFVFFIKKNKTKKNTHTHKQQQQQQLKIYEINTKET